MFKKIISILIILIAVFAMLYLTGIFDDLFKKDIEPMESGELSEEKGMTQLKVSSKIIGKSIEIENIKITDNNPSENKVLTSINDEGRAVWKDINDVIEEEDIGYSNKKLFYVLIVFFSAFLIIYVLKSTNRKEKKRKEKTKNGKNKDDQVNFLDN